jgi:AmmeMemoRadiSam system protein A
MCSVERHFSDDQRRMLLDLARASIGHGIEHGRHLAVNLEDYPVALRETLACFVTLNRRGQLRGCIGHLEAVQPLVRDVAENAYSAAFRDPRFPPLEVSELDGLEVHISVLTPPQSLAFDSEADLLRQIRPGVDGLILEDGHARGTFLPSVWESLPRVEDFWLQLKRKAGLPADHWSATVRVSRYRTESFA